MEKRKKKKNRPPHKHSWMGRGNAPGLSVYCDAGVNTTRQLQELSSISERKENFS